MTILEQKMQGFIDSINQSLENENYFAALTVALTLPDICGKLDSPDLSSSKRYSKWVDEFLRDSYSMEVMGKKHIFLSGNDAYALRCSFLHGGESDISTQRIQEVLEEFVFITPSVKEGISTGSHNIQINNRLILRVDMFCEDICRAVSLWSKENSTNNRILDSAAKMMTMHSAPIVMDGIHVGR